MSSARFALHRDTRDGVPVLWTPQDGTLTGVLKFRVGWADETVLTRGLTHVVEHLAMYWTGGKQTYGLNAGVDGITTWFGAKGTPGEVASFLSGVCRALADPPMERLSAECRVLRAEAAQRDGNALSQALAWRYGSRAGGLQGAPELFLDAPVPDRIRAWVRERFTRGNAVAWFNGPIPPGLDFQALPLGRRFACPVHEPVGEVPTPCYTNGPTGGMSVSFEGEREQWMGAGLSFVQMRLLDRLRFEKGLAYHVEHHYQVIESHRAHSIVCIRCLEAHVPRVQAEVVNVLHEVAAEGPTAEELQRAHDGMARAPDNPDAANAQLDMQALDELIGYPVTPWPELIEEMKARTPDQWAASVRAALDSAMLTRPGGAPEPHPSFAFDPGWSGKVARGRRFAHVSRRYPWSRPHFELIVGADEVSVVQFGSGAMTVPLTTCEGAALYPTGLLRVVARNGTAIVINPSEWKGGQRACDLALQGIPEDRLLVIPRH